MVLNWNLGSRTLCRGRLPLLMGILNTTPDSFSDGGKFLPADLAVEHGLQLVSDGADILDVGGESTRPGSQPVSTEEELRRTIPVIERLAKQITVPISIDTTKSEVARHAIDAGATIVNDISGATFDAKMISICSRSNVGVCLMHIQGIPETMQQNPHYENVVSEVMEFLHHRIEDCLEAGIPRERLCLDPGIGFGKTAEHNLQLMQSIPLLHRTLDRPVLIGHSRKRFLSKVLGREVEERLAGTLGVSIALSLKGADILRVHDIRAVRDSLLACMALLDPEDPETPR